MKINSLQKGDTIIEVMFAFAVMGLVIVLTLSAMNRGVATTQMAVESTLVRQQLDGQAEALRYLRNTNNNQWQEIIRDRVGSATPFDDSNTNCEPATGTRPFFIEVNIPSDDNPVGSTALKDYHGSGGTGEVFAQPGKGMWIEAVKQSSPPNNFIDFHIQACWTPPFNGPNAKIGTIVRLYE